MEKREILILSVCLIVGFFFVYSPHFFNPYPIHVDEWHHISEAIKIKNGDYTVDSNSFRIGFQLFLTGLSYFLDIVKNYQFFPAIWSVFTALILFFVSYKKSNNFWIGIFSIIFFFSLKSNVNIEGLWFFVPLTFSIPFIFLYFYFFTEFFETGKNKNFFFALIIMLFLIPVHIISLSFVIPIFFIYSAINWKLVIKKYKYFLSLLLIPILSILLFKFIFNLSISNVSSQFFNAMSFPKGWAGVSEYNNSFLEIYSLIGYIFAFWGTFYLFKQKKNIAYILWPIACLTLITIFRLFDVSYLAPYQRVFYYFALSLPFLSAIGLWNCYLFLGNKLKKFKFKNFLLSIFFIIVFFSIFINYNFQNTNYSLYSFIGEKEYSSLLQLRDLPQGKVLANPFVSIGVYPISGKFSYSDIYFENILKINDVEQFFYYSDCDWKRNFLFENNIKFILSDKKIECGFTELYQKDYYIYTYN